MTAAENSPFETIRNEFPHTENLVYLNSASYGPYSTRVRDALNEHIDARVDSQADKTSETFALRGSLREDYAALIGAEPGQIGIGLNTSFGLNVAAYGLPLEPGDEILVSDIEFPAIIYTFRAAAETRGLKLNIVPSKDRRFDFDALKKAVTKRSRVLAISWVQFFNGYKTDLTRLRDFCRENNLFFVVDGIQGTGIEPIDVRRLDIDIFTTGCQKWLLAPQGCGFFYISDRVRDQLAMPSASWLGVDWKMDFGDLFKFDLDFYDTAERFEMGYYVELNLIGMNASVQIFRELGVDHIREHNYALIDRLADYISKSDYYEITSSLKPEHRSSIFTFTCDNYQAAHKELYRNKIVCVHREGSIRISTHLFNNQHDIDRVIAILDKIAASA